MPHRRARQRSPFRRGAHGAPETSRCVGVLVQIEKGQAGEFFDPSAQKPRQCCPRSVGDTGGSALGQVPGANVTQLIRLHCHRSSRRAQRDLNAVGGLFHQIDYGRQGHAFLHELSGDVNLAIGAHRVIAGDEVLGNRQHCIFVRQLAFGRIERAGKSQQSFQHLRIRVSVRGHGLKNRGPAFRRQQFSEGRGARGVAAGELRLDLSILQNKRAGQFLGRLIIQTNRGKQAGQFIVESREAAELANKTQRSLRLQWALVGEQCARQRNLTPGVSRFNRHCLLRQIKRPRWIIVRCKPVGRAGQQRKIARLVLVLQGVAQLLLGFVLLA